MLSLLLELSFSACTSYTRLAEHMEFTQGCTDVRDSFFQDLSGFRGGGIDFLVSSGSLSVFDTTFLRCSAVPNYDSQRGGGINHEGTLMAIERCCFRETSTSGYGTAISYSSLSGTALGTVNVTDASFTSCYAIGDGTGTICDKKGAYSTLLRLNFTGGRMAVSQWVNEGDGIAILSIGLSAYFTFSYSTVLDSVASTGIDIESEIPPVIENCNFYNNVFTDGTHSYALFYADDYGMIVRYCVFNNNSDIFRIYTDDPEVGFTFSDCVFSGSIDSWGQGDRVNSTGSFQHPILSSPHTLTFKPLHSIFAPHGVQEILTHFCSQPLCSDSTFCPP
jgi:hypothetical protein